MYRFLAAGLVAATFLSACVDPQDPPSKEGVFALRQVASDPFGGGDATLAPDGQKFVISSRRAGHWDLWQFDLETSAWSQLTDHPADDFEARWSPDGSLLAFTSTRGDGKHIWLQHTSDGHLEQLTFGEHEEEYADWSPDGSLISYTAGPWLNRDVFLLPAEGGEPRRVTKTSGMAGACSFDPGGESLVCHRYDLGAGNLERMWLDGETAPLTQGSAWDYKPNVSPDGEWIAFSRSVEGPSRIWLIPGKGGRAVQLTDSPYDDRWPTWGAGGKRLFFHRLVDVGTSLRMVDSTSGEVTELVGADERPLQASFDPSGTRVVFCSEGPNGKQLLLRDLDGGSSVRLDTGPGEACFPRWSPRGDRIAFVFKPDPAARWELGVVAPDGSDRQALTSGFGELRGLDGSIDWSPDGKLLVFQSDTDPYEANLFVLEVDIGELRRLTKDHWFDESPSFTADGTGVLFMSTRGGGWTWGLFRYDLDSASITAFAGPDYTEKNFPRGAADGSIVWTRVDAQGERVVRLAPGAEAEAEIAGTEAGRWPSLSADGKRLLFTTVDHQVEYWLIENPTGVGSPARAEPVASGDSLARRFPAAPVGNETAGLAAEGGEPNLSASGEETASGDKEICTSAVRQPAARLARFEGYRRQGTECREVPAESSRPDTSPVDLHHR